MQTLLHTIKVTAIWLSLVCTPALSSAATLLMIEQPYCPHCERFNEEVGGIYPKTAEGKRAPLVRLQLNVAWPEPYNAIEKAVVTPTFILVHEGKEIDRLLGYQGDEFFWFLIADLLKKIPE